MRCIAQAKSVNAPDAKSFRRVRLAPFRGRGLTLQDEKDHSQVALLSDAYWDRRFGRSPAVLGSTLFVKGVPFTIVGITASRFNGVGGADTNDFWIPLQNNPDLNAWGNTGKNTLYGTPRWW